MLGTGVSVEKLGVTNRVIPTLALAFFYFFVCFRTHAVVIAGAGLLLRNRTSRLRFWAVAAR